jgi:hypothetical protein
MPDPIHGTTWTRGRPTLIVGVLLALVLAGAVAARAEPSPQAQAGPTLRVVARGELPTGQWAGLSPAVQVGSDVLYPDFDITVGSAAYLTVLGTAWPGEGKIYCSGFWGERDYYWSFTGWTAQRYAPNSSAQPFDPLGVDKMIDSPQVSVNGITDVPGSDVDHYVHLWYTATCV